MKKIYFLQRLRRLLKTYQNHQFVFIVPGGVIKGKLLFENELEQYDQGKESNYFHMASVPISLKEEYETYMNSSNFPYAPNYNEEDALVLVDVTLQIAGQQSQLDSLLLFPNEIIAFTVEKKV